MRVAAFLATIAACLYAGRMLCSSAPAQKFNFLVKGEQMFQGRPAYRIAPVYPVNVLVEQLEGPHDLVRGDALSCKIRNEKVGTARRDGQESDLVQTMLACDKGVKLAVRVVILEPEQ